MKEIGEKFLPIGTVVVLKGGIKRVMIIGFCTSMTQGENKEMWDYSGCIYPEGLLRTDQICLFNHDQIEEVYHLGLVDDEEVSFKTRLKELVEAAENKEKQTKTTTKSKTSNSKSTSKK